MAKSLTQRYIEGLRQRGYLQIESRSKKYLTFKHPAYSELAFVGKGGAVRHGRTTTESIPYSDNSKAELLGEA